MKKYYSIFSHLPDEDYEGCVTYLKKQLEYLFTDEYQENFFNDDIRLFEDTKKRFYTFLFDCTDDYEGDGDSRSARVVGVFGRSTIKSTAIYRRRQYEFVGSFSKIPGYEAYDKGHFIPHSNDGQPDHNLYPQLRELNRGWSLQGKLYRSMERYCQQNEGTFFFVRPIYSTLNWFADQIDFGIFTQERGLLLNRFNNKTDKNSL
jgi:hypothetical protein